MALVIREFETMVDETLQRIVDANIGITNILPGSVIRTIIEAIMAETDIQNYTIDQIYKAMNIDTSTGSDLDALVTILGISRKQATSRFRRLPELAISQSSACFPTSKGITARSP